MSKRKLTPGKIQELKEFYPNVGDILHDLIHDLELLESENKKFQHDYTKACFDRDYYEDKHDGLEAKVERLKENLKDCRRFSTVDTGYIKVQEEDIKRLREHLRMCVKFISGGALLSIPQWLIEAQAVLKEKPPTDSPQD